MLNCNYCRTPVTENSQFCPNCQFPLQGTEKEKSGFIAKLITQKGDVETAFARLKNARIILFIIGAFYIIVPFLRFGSFPDATEIIGNFIFGGLFIIFGFISIKSPKIGFLIPLILIASYYILILIIEPFQIFSGMIWKVIAIVGVGYGFFSAMKSNKILKDNAYLASKFRKGEKNTENILDEDL
jgi:hypothetical protein